MNVITHALLPALLAAPLLRHADMPDFRRRAAIVAAAGALPDLLHPHLSLAARYSSWTHSVFALGGFAVCAAIAGLSLRRWLPGRVPALAVAAFALHLATDACAGGIAWLQPLSPEAVGRRLIPYDLWFPVDLVMIVAAALVFLRPAGRSAAAVGPPATPLNSGRPN